MENDGLEANGFCKLEGDLDESFGFDKLVKIEGKHYRIRNEGDKSLDRSIAIFNENYFTTKEEEVVQLKLGEDDNIFPEYISILNLSGAPVWITDPEKFNQQKFLTETQDSIYQYEPGTHTIVKQDSEYLC